MKIKCRICGYEYDPEETRGTCDGIGCCGCEECNEAMCPNCGYMNKIVYEEEFEFIEKLKSKIKNKIAAK
ncbi:MAG: hypothetical protein ACI4VU_00240 [Methanobrevibacter sp.]